MVASRSLRCFNSRFLGGGLLMILISLASFGFSMEAEAVLFNFGLEVENAEIARIKWGLGEECFKALIFSWNKE